MKKTGIKEWEFLKIVCTNYVLKNIDLNSKFLTIKENFDWELFYSFANTNKVIPIVYDELKQLENIIIPKKIENNMFFYTKFIIEKNFTYSNELKKLNDVLNTHKIDFVAYKGIILSQYIYQNVGIRPTLDLDIMIKVEDLDKIKNILNLNNYEYSKPLSKNLLKNLKFIIKKYIGDKIVYIDTHWRVSNLLLQMKVGYDEMISEAKLINFYGTKINLLNPEAHFIIIAMHHFGKNEMSLKQFIDLVVILEKFKDELNWTKLVMLSKKWKVYKLTLYSLKICQEIINNNLPNKISQLIENECDKKFINKNINSFNLNKGKLNENVKDIFIGRIKLHLKIRDNFWIKLKIAYLHLKAFITPKEVDFKNPRKISSLQWYLTFLKKPFCLFYKFYIKN